MMLTFFTLAYLYINIKIFKSGLKINKKMGFSLAIVAILGFLTQYFFAIYAALVSIVMICLYISNKQYKDMRKYIAILVISAVIGLLIFPFSIGHMLFSDRRITVFRQTNYFEKTFEYFKLILKYFGSDFEIVLALFAIALLSIVIKRKKERGLMTIIILPTILYIIATAILAEFLELRYVMNILPIIAILIAMAISTIFENETYNKMVAVAGLIVLTGYGFLTEQPICLYKGYNKYIEIAEEYKENDLVYVGYSYFNHIQAIPEFMKYNKTLILYDTELDTLIDDEELKDKNEFILSVNKTMNPDKVLNEVLEKTGYTNHEIIFEGVEGVDQKLYRIYR